MEMVSEVSMMFMPVDIVKKYAFLFLVFLLATHSDAAVYKIGVVTDIHHGTHKVPVHCYAAVQKTRLAIADFERDNCDLIVQLGDYINTEKNFPTIYNINPNYVTKDSVYYNIGDPCIPKDFNVYPPWGTPAYFIPPVEMTWLESDLQAADAAGKFSVIFSHQSPTHPGHIFNYLDVQDIFERHNVILSFAGHSHLTMRQYIG